MQKHVYYPTQVFDDVRFGDGMSLASSPLLESPFMGLEECSPFEFPPIKARPALVPVIPSFRLVPPLYPAPFPAASSTMKTTEETLLPSALSICDGSLQTSQSLSRNSCDSRNGSCGDCVWRTDPEFNSNVLFESTLILKGRREKACSEIPDFSDRYFMSIRYNLQHHMVSHLKSASFEEGSSSSPASIFILPQVRMLYSDTYREARNKGGELIFSCETNPLKISQIGCGASGSLAGSGISKVRFLDSSYRNDRRTFLLEVSYIDVTSRDVLGKYFSPVFKIFARKPQKKNGRKKKKTKRSVVAKKKSSNANRNCHEMLSGPAPFTGVKRERLELDSDTDDNDNDDPFSMFGPPMKRRKTVSGGDSTGLVEFSARLRDVSQALNGMSDVEKAGALAMLSKRLLPELRC